MSAVTAPVLVLGVGNVLMGDDGVGGRVVDALQAGATDGSLDLPADVVLVDGGTLGVDLLPWLTDARAAVLVDAAFVGGAPGTISVWRDDVAAGGAAAGGPDGAGLADLLATAQLTGELPAAISIMGIQPGALEARVGLSDAVAAALPTAVATALAEIRRVDALSRPGRAPEGTPDMEMAGVTA